MTASIDGHAGRPLAVPYAGDDEAKPAARRLIEDIGAAPSDAGDLSRTRHLEAMGVVVIRQLFGGANLSSTFAFLTSES